MCHVGSRGTVHGSEEGVCTCMKGLMVSHILLRMCFRVVHLQFMKRMALLQSFAELFRACRHKLQSGTSNYDKLTSSWVLHVWTHHNACHGTFAASAEQVTLNIFKSENDMMQFCTTTARRRAEVTVDYLLELFVRHAKP